MGKDRLTGTRESNYIVLRNVMRNNGFLKLCIAMHLVLSQKDCIR